MISLLNHGKHDCTPLHLAKHLNWNFFNLWSEHRNCFKSFFFCFLIFEFFHFHFLMFLMWSVGLCQMLKKSREPALCAHHAGTPLSVNGHTCLLLPIRQHNSSTAGCDWTFLCSVPKSSGDEVAHTQSSLTVSLFPSFLSLTSSQTFGGSPFFKAPVET